MPCVSLPERILLVRRSPPDKAATGDLLVVLQARSCNTYQTDSGQVLSRHVMVYSL